MPRKAPLERYAPKLVGVAMLIVLLLALIVTWRSLIGLGATAWLKCAAIAMVAISIGHVMGGPARETRTVLAGFSAIRFPALALLLASIVPRGAELIPVVIAYAICSGLLVGIYRAAMGRLAGKTHAAPSRAKAGPPVSRPHGSWR